MRGKLHQLTENVKHRSTLKNFKRCGLLYKKQLRECRKCTDVDDDKLEALLRQRAVTRVGLGNIMLIGAAIFAVLIFIVNLIS